MRDRITNVQGALAPQPPRRRGPRRQPARPFELPGEDRERGGADGSEHDAVLRPRPRRALDERVAQEPLAEEAGQSIDVRA